MRAVPCVRHGRAGHELQPDSTYQILRGVLEGGSFELRVS